MTDIVETVDDTLATWQQAIYDECLKVALECGVAESSIDGAGSDGDELEFTLAEIEQAFNLLRDERDAARAELSQLGASYIKAVNMGNSIAIKLESERDAARQSRARLVQLWQARGSSARSWHAAERTWKP